MATIRTMTNAAYFDAVTTDRVYRDLFHAENCQTFLELNEVAASEWGRRELFGCRVVRRGPLGNVLPILPSVPSQDSVSTEIRNFIEGPTGTHMAQSEHDLVRKFGILGQVWAAMAIFKGPPGRSGTINLMDSSDDGSDREAGKRQRSKRIRRNTQEYDYVDSGMIQVGSSSPIPEDSQGTSSVGYVDAECHSLLALPEDGTLRLASCVIRYILLFAPPQDLTSVPVVVEFRDTKTKLSASTPVRKRRIIAIDDGGLCLRQEFAGVSRLSKNCVAILEAKRQFQSLENGRPVISDKCFAQMTREALVARLAYPIEEFPCNSVILINATQHYMCFLQFEITHEYLNDLESVTPTCSMSVYSTRVFDLGSRGDREHVVSNVRGIMQLARSS